MEFEICSLNMYFNYAFFLGQLRTIMPASPVHSSFQEDVDSPQTLQINSIGALQELCSEKNIPAPQFELKADIGPAHSREFTMECRVASLTAIATELTKKKAKQSAAQIMLHRLVDMLPDEIEEHFATSDCTSLRPVIESDELLRRYNELSTYNKRRTNWGIKMKDSPQALVNLMDEKDIEYEDLWEVGIIKEYIKTSACMYYRI